MRPHHVGYLLVRGGLHVYAYALALKRLTGVDAKKIMPVPTLSNTTFPETPAFMPHDLHCEPYIFSPDVYMKTGLIWNGKHPEDGSELVVIQGAKIRSALSRTRRRARRQFARR